VGSMARPRPVLGASGPSPGAERAGPAGASQVDTVFSTVRLAGVTIPFGQVWTARAPDHRTGEQAGYPRQTGAWIVPTFG
jgi:hypothetical protein